MPPYWLIQLTLIVSFTVLLIVSIRPIRSSRDLALRRLLTITLMLLGMYAVLVPATLNRIAHLLGVERGINLLVYGLVLTFFALAASAFRREGEQQRRIDELARALALASVIRPTPQSDQSLGEQTDPEGSDTRETRSEFGQSPGE